MLWSNMREKKSSTVLLHNLSTNLYAVQINLVELHNRYVLCISN